MPDPTRIMLLDDHALVRGGIARLLGAQPDFEIAGEAATIEEGIEIVQKAQVDLVLLDINLGSQQGGAFINLAREAGFRGKILVVTAGVSTIEAKRLAQRGCCGIFLKHQQPTLLIDRIRDIVAGREPPAEPAGEAVAGAVLDDQARPLLTARESEVLRGVFAGRSNKEIAHALGISEPLVKAFVQQLFQKTGVRNRAQLVRMAIERYWEELEETPKR